MVISMADAYFHEFIFYANISYRSNMIHKKCQWILLVLVWIVDMKSWIIFLWRVFQLQCLYLFNKFVNVFKSILSKKLESQKKKDFHHVLHSLCLKMSGLSLDTNFNVWPQKFTLVRPQGPLSKRAPKGIQAQSKFGSNNFWSSSLIFLYPTCTIITCSWILTVQTLTNTEYFTK